MGTIAGATITVAGIAFSVSLLMIQSASSQFSPRVLHGFFRDRFTKRVLGLVVGTFAYCLLVLRAVRGPLDESGQAIIPHISVFVALILGLLSILAIVAFINHSAHSMEVGEIMRRVASRTQEQIARICPALGEGAPEADPSIPEPPGADDALVVRARIDGWVQQIDVRGLLEAADEGGTVRLETLAGDFRTERAVLCRIWPRPEDEERAVKEAREAVRLGRWRTMQDDLGFGIRQLADIALRALSPGVNDPTTAQDAIVHLGSILREMLLRDLPPVHHEDDDGRRLFRASEMTHADYVALAYGQIRRAASRLPAVATVMLQVLGQLGRRVKEAGRPERAEALRAQARLLLDGLAAEHLVEEDLAEVRERARAEGLIDYSSP